MRDRARDLRVVAGRDLDERSATMTTRDPYEADFEIRMKTTNVIVTPHTVQTSLELLANWLVERAKAARKEADSP